MFSTFGSQPNWMLAGSRALLLSDPPGELEQPASIGTAAASSAAPASAVRIRWLWKGMGSLLGVGEVVEWCDRSGGGGRSDGQQCAHGRQVELVDDADGRPVRHL